MDKKAILINCDLGEGMLTDETVMPFIDACSIACGGHFGDEKSIRQTIQLAKKNVVKIGAHPSYPDRENFGRKSLSLDASELQKSIIDQLLLFNKVAMQEECEVHHIKLHGALYNDAAKQPNTAQLVVDVLRKTMPEVALFCPYQSALAMAAKPFFKLVYEGFADRRYNADLSLVSRTNSNALITDPFEALEQIKSIIETEKTTTITGKIVPIRAETFCLHGDNPNCTAILAIINEYNQSCEANH